MLVVLYFFVHGCIPQGEPITYSRGVIRISKGSRMRLSEVTIESISENRILYEWTCLTFPMKCDTLSIKDTVHSLLHKHDKLFVDIKTRLINEDLTHNRYRYLLDGDFMADTIIILFRDRY
jgi:hypothetical protein